MNQLDDRISLLIEQRLAQLSLDDLPIKALLAKLDNDWTPDAKTLLLRGSVSLEAIDPAALGCLQQYTAATLPAAATLPWRLVAVTDGAAGAQCQFSNGVAWLNVA